MLLQLRFGFVNRRCSEAQSREARVVEESDTEFLWWVKLGALRTSASSALDTGGAAQQIPENFSSRHAANTKVHRSPDRAFSRVLTVSGVSRLHSFLQSGVRCAAVGYAMTQVGHYTLGKTLGQGAFGKYV